MNVLKKISNWGKALSHTLYPFYTLLFLVFITKFNLLNSFGARFTDDDQSLMAQGLHEFSQGRFHETRFFGQAYNTMLEALLALPLYKIGWSPFWALPFVTTCLAVAPFLWIAFYFRKKHPSISVISLAVLLLLPIEYDFITMMPRGFVTGLAASILVFPAFYGSTTKRSYFLLGLGFILSYSISANSLLLTLPVCCYVFWEQKKDRRFYWFTILGITFGLIIHFLLQSYYWYHPEKVLHYYKMVYSWDNFWTGITHLDRYFSKVTPLLWKSGWPIVFLFLGMSIYLFFRKCLSLAFFSLAVFVVVLGSLFASKVHDGSEDVFFHYGRMYLALPILLVLFFSKRKFDLRWGVIVLVFLSLGVSYYKIAGFREDLAAYEFRTSAVRHSRINYVQDELQYMDSLAHVYDVDLIVFENHWLSSMMCYAGPLLRESTIPMWDTKGDRRTWLVEELSQNKFRKVLLIDSEMGGFQSSDYQRVSKYYGVLNLENARFSEVLKKIITKN